MTTSQVMLGSQAAPRTIEWAGKTYTVGKLTHNAMDAFSAWVANRRRERIVQGCSDDQIELKKRLDEHREDVISGVFEFSEPLILGKPVRVAQTRKVDGREATGHVTVAQGGAISTGHGRIALVAILCDCTGDEAMALLSHKPAEMNHLLELSFAESFGGKDDWTPEPADPNAPPAQA